MTERDRPSSLDDITERLRTARGGADGGDGRSGGRRGPEKPSGLGIGFRISVEFVTTVLVGVGIGYLLDQWLGTAPWLMLVFIFLGLAAAVMNIHRVVRGLDDSVGFGQAVRRNQESDADQASRNERKDGGKSG